MDTIASHNWWTRAQPRLSNQVSVKNARMCRKPGVEGHWIVQTKKAAESAALSVIVPPESGLGKRQFGGECRSHLQGRLHVVFAELEKLPAVRGV